MTLKRVLLALCFAALVGDMVLLHYTLKAEGKAFVERIRV